MSHRLEDKQARRAEREAAQRALEASQRRRRRAGYAGMAAIAATLVTLAVVLGGSSGSGSGGHGPMATGDGTGPEVGSLAPAFALTDTVSGRQITSDSLRGKKTLLFFSEGVNCQACMVQAADLEKAPAIKSGELRLLSVTTDPPGDLAQAARQYGIRMPLLADPTTGMSAAYGMLGHGGMGHPTQDGHAFMLVDERGKVVWHRAYQEMYVKNARLMADMRAETAA